MTLEMSILGAAAADASAAWL